MSDSGPETKASWPVRARAQVLRVIRVLSFCSVYCLAPGLLLSFVSHGLAEFALLAAFAFMLCAGLAGIGWFAIQALFFFQYSLRTLMLMVLWTAGSVTLIVAVEHDLARALGGVSLLFVVLVVISQIAQAGNPAANAVDNRPNEQAPGEDNNGTAQ
jgi:TM2 domain-containing membrane protein YozV